jgi:hypothetical protein
LGGRAGGLGEDWHAEFGGGAPVDLGEFVLGAGKADFEAFDFAGPAFAFGFGDAGGEVVADLCEPVALGRVRPVDGAADAPLTELTPIFQQFMAGFRSPALICPRDRIG